MKKITFFIFLLTIGFGFSQNAVTVNEADIVNAYVNAFNESDNSYAFGFSYSLPAMKTTFPTSTSIILYPNFAIWDENDDTPTDGGPMWDPAWFDASNDPNKVIEGISYAQDNSLSGSDLTFTATVDAVTIDAGYTVQAFIKVLDAGYGTLVYNTVDLTSVGDFTVTASAAETGSGPIVQYGFVVTGLIADPANEATLGNVTITAKTLSVNDFKIAGLNVFPNPTQDSWTVKTNNIQMSSIKVFDILGKQVLSLTPNNSEARINGSKLRSGLYFATIKTTSGSSSLKLVKE